MSKIKLCSKDEENLIEELQHSSEVLEEIGVEGVAAIVCTSNGDIRSRFCLNTETELSIMIENDGDKVTREYRY